MAWYIFPQFIMEKGPKISSGSLENTIAILPKLQFFIGVRSYRMSSVLLSKEPCVCESYSSHACTNFWKMKNLLKNVLSLWSKLRKNIFFRTCFRLNTFQTKWKTNVKKNIRNCDSRTLNKKLTKREKKTKFVFGFYYV